MLQQTVHHILQLAKENGSVNVHYIGKEEPHILIYDKEKSNYQVKRHDNTPLSIFSELEIFYTLNSSLIRFYQSNERVYQVANW